METILKSAKKTVIISPEKPTVLIGERINPTGKKRLAAALVEGDLEIIRQEALAQVARDMNLGDYINLGGGELKSGGFRRSSILCDTLEAIIGAIYLDGGLDAASETITTLYHDYLRTLPDIHSLKDAKTCLQEYLQSKQIELPDYLVVKTVGKSHDQVFTVSCSVESIGLKSTGRGLSRKKAEQDAARKALGQLKQ